jgi:hypothetical protein
MDRREIERRIELSRKFTDEQWRFHKTQWGPLEVLVLPRHARPLPREVRRPKQRIRVIDSNTGLVMTASRHSYLLGNVVVLDGCRPNCDTRALNYLINGNEALDWDSAGLHPYAIPQDGPPNRGGDWLNTKQNIMARGFKPDQAEIQADFMTGWGKFSIQCLGCRLVVPCGSIERVFSEAQRYGFQVTERAGQKRPVCRSCAEDPANGPLERWPQPEAVKI